MVLERDRVLEHPAGLPRPPLPGPPCGTPDHPSIVLGGGGDRPGGGTEGSGTNEPGVTRPWHCVGPMPSTRKTPIVLCSRALALARTYPVSWQSPLGLLGAGAAPPHWIFPRGSPRRPKPHPASQGTAPEGVATCAGLGLWLHFSLAAPMPRGLG